MSVLDVVRVRAQMLGRVSLTIVPISMVGQVASLVQQGLHLFDPAPGERSMVIGVLVAVLVLGVAGIVAGAFAATAREGRRTGLLGASLGGATLVLFALGSSFLWSSLAIF